MNQVLHYTGYWMALVNAIYIFAKTNISPYVGLVNKVNCYFYWWFHEYQGPVDLE